MPFTGEQLFRAMFRGAPTFKTTSSPNQFAGRTLLASGSNTVVVSTRTVGSDSIILTSLQAATDQASGFGQGVEVKSINPGNAFVMGWQDPNSKPARDTTVHWVLAKGS